MNAIIGLSVLAIALSGVYGDCFDDLSKAKGQDGKPLLGAFIPKCNSDATYEEMQCHEGYCYCVFPQSGVEVLGTRVRFARPENCELTPCFNARHQGMVLLKRGLLGVSVPRCDSNGDYSTVQCRKGMCWCADPLTGKAIGQAGPSMPNC
ncbi:thyroglobulin-like [Hydractinia symbiolongicarpus]|uniref:thyroglobulin-like n=1 Tax=Hydractinia symbiolongicarpus TaxID=13093 RepID=UPI00254F0FD0|nr:thyroglobulin-like [Hydractinia symbiolongicarpus]